MPKRNRLRACASRPTRSNAVKSVSESPVGPAARRLRDEAAAGIASPSARRLVSTARAFRTALHAWYDQHSRQLPWREAPSLYQTVVSEFMLQQTQVKTVLPYFTRWLAALPSFPALAAADEATVLRLWEGLGYYARARNLHRLARCLAGMSPAPRTPEAWRELPGVGPYTAAAITSIAFKAHAACVDGNVVRILARLTADETAFRDSAAAARHFTVLAGALLSAERPGDHNQAMMELGATVCLRHQPRCTVCPVRPFCAAARLGQPTSFPRLAAKSVQHQLVIRVWCERAGRLLLHRASASARRLASIHELPTASEAGIAAAQATRGELLARKRRTITRHHLTESIYVAPAPRHLAGPGLVWVPLSQLDAVTLSGPHRRWIGEILAARRAD